MERAALSDLMAEYGMALDEDRLEDWVELFEEQCDYRVVTRENVAQRLPNVLMWCDNKNMLRDRVESYRHVNEYNPHYDRHVIGPLRLLDEKDGVARSDGMVPVSAMTSTCRSFAAPALIAASTR